MKATKHVAGKSKLELAQFAELEVFAQIASDLDYVSCSNNPNEPLTVEEQIVTKV